jgi:hypothetical protein
LEEAKNLELDIVAIKRAEAQTELDILNKATELVKQTTEWKNQLAEAQVKLNNIDTEYFTKQRALDRSLQAAKNEDRRSSVDFAKKALEKRLKDEENALNKEINQLKQARLLGVITEKEYNKKVEELTMESLNRKIKIRGQEKDKILQLEAQILDAEIKQQTEADKDLLDELKRTVENQLSLLESGKNKRLELLQEQETDQKIYALRAAEIETEAQKEREEIIRSFGVSLENAEFQNGKIRLDAIEENEKKIIDETAKSLKEQEKLRKLFAKTTADFDRLYNIKTWEQRKEDELRILKKQYEEKLLSEETYQLALIALNRKYEDEKLKIRQQYGLSSLKDLFNSELKLLQEQYDKKLLSEEEFQRAQLEIKLKYAQQYAQLSQEFSQAGASSVKSIEEAQTAKTQAEYEKRQVALSEQYSQGLISQEEYNSSKEELDYEQKSKELEIQKKYADVNFAIQVAEIIATTAQGIITAWATSMRLGPIAGPIAAAALSALLGITSAAQLTKAKAERDRVKSMSLESPGSGSPASMSKTGEIRLKEGFAEGGFNRDLSSGGYTGHGKKYELAGYLPVHGGEYIIAQDELRQPQIMNMARAVERERRKRTHANAVSGFAEGGSNTLSGIGSGVITLDGKSAGRIAEILERLERGDIVIQTHYGVTELEAEQRRKMETESKFTRKT